MRVAKSTFDFHGLGNILTVEQAKLVTLVDDTEKTAFFINLFNLITLHSMFVDFPTKCKSAAALSRFQKKTSYWVCGAGRFSLYRVVDGSIIATDRSILTSTRWMGCL